MGYQKLAIKGVTWMSALRGVTRSLAIVRTALLARILLPSQFGVYGIALLVLGFLEILTETGINIFLIQEKDKIDEYVDSAWAVSILRGILISCVILISIPLITTFFNTPGARTILLLTSVIPLIRGFINPSVIKFQKNLEFNKQFFYESSIFFIDASVAISLGILTHSENSLIWGMIAGALFEVFISFFIVKPRPKFVLERKKVLVVINRGKWVTGAGIFNYFFENLDDILVGRFLGTHPLGIYQQAYKISSLPVSEVGEIFNKVTFPIYSKIDEDKARLKKAFSKILAAITLFVIPFGILFFFFPDIIVTILLGERWVSAIPVLRILAIYCVLKAISNSIFSLLLALKKQEIVTLVTFVRVLAMAITIVPLIKGYGLIGAAVSGIFAILASLPITVYYYKNLLK